MNVVVWTALAFLAGSLPFSVWIGRTVLHRDIRAFGDGNPGALNVLRAGGRGSALAALLLDFTKGALPVGLLCLDGKVRGWALVPVAVAPLAGHALSPFLHGRGGKAVAVTGGVWCGLTAWEGPTVGGLLLAAATWLFGANGWAVVTAHIGMVAYTALAPQCWNRLTRRPRAPILLVIGLGQLLILAWKHRAELAQPPRVRGR